MWWRRCIDQISLEWIHCFSLLGKLWQTFQLHGSLSHEWRGKRKCVFFLVIKKCKSIKHYVFGLMDKSKLCSFPYWQHIVLKHKLVFSVQYLLKFLDLTQNFRPKRINQTISLKKEKSIKTMQIKSENSIRHTINFVTFNYIFRSSSTNILPCELRCLYDLILSTNIPSFMAAFHHVQNSETVAFHHVYYPSSFEAAETMNFLNHIALWKSLSFAI